MRLPFALNMRIAIHWFRRDLRLTDNTALAQAVANSDLVIPVYVLSAWRGRHGWTGPPRQDFLCQCLQSLDAAIRAKGGRLIFRRGAADVELEKLIGETGAAALYFNRDPDPFGRRMEQEVIRMAEARGCTAYPCKDVAIHERNEVVTGAGTPYRVFSPYARAWTKLPKQKFGGTIDRFRGLERLDSRQEPTLASWGLKRSASIIKGGESEARKRLEAFLAGPILEYGSARNVPRKEATSRLSADLRFGTLSIREVHARCVCLAEEAGTAEHRRSVLIYINELIWRDFYMQILWHYPEVLEHGFNPKFRNVEWADPGEVFEQWCRGETGFPIIDAAMRQLNETGFMHNRLRMITAMFLTKDLHISWRAGESYFMRKLVDGDIASNNGGWQWSAGTGADAAPYFRIQNPWTQTQRYDPEGEFIKRWVPELRDVDPVNLMQPPDSGTRLDKGYPVPMVDHATERDVTLRMFSGFS